MNILADTHILLWAIFDKKELSEYAREIITNPDNEIYYSSISVWEVEIKHKIRPELMTIDGSSFANYCRESGFHPINFTEQHAILCESLQTNADELHHNDPFDKSLIAQAKAGGFKFMTHDKKISYYNEPCILNV